MHEKDEQNSSPVSFEVSITRLPQKGMPVVFEADARQREALADVHGLLSVDRFRADLLVTSWKRNGVKVTGKVHAVITQQCVVTLEPIEASVEEEIDSIFLPADSKLGRLGFGEGGEILVDADGPDAPETFSGDTIDVGDLAVEFFGLGVDPYPRKPGASLASDEDASAPDLPEGPLQEKLRKLTEKK